MKRRTVWILLAGVVVGVMLSGFLHRRAAEREPENAQPLDGAGTYVDNNALWSRISGDWISSDGHWTLKLEGEDSMTLLLDSETVAETSLSFTYLCPEPARETELSAETPQLNTAGAPYSKIVSLTHEAGERDGTLTLELLDTDEKTETVTFQKAE